MDNESQVGVSLWHADILWNLVFFSRFARDLRGKSEKAFQWVKYVCSRQHGVFIWLYYFSMEMGCFIPKEELMDTIENSNSGFHSVTITHALSFTITRQCWIWTFKKHFMWAINFLASSSHCCFDLCDTFDMSVMRSKSHGFAKVLCSLTSHQSVKYDYPGECSREKHCSWLHWLTFDNLSRSHHQSQVNCESSVDVISLWWFTWLVDKVTTLLVICHHF